MSDNLILVDRQHPQVTIITLNRPDKRNALNVELLEQLKNSIQETQEMEDQRVIILAGSGTVFCAGLDLTEASDHENSEKSSKAFAEALKAIYLSPLVTFAMVHGSATAGGAGLMIACDFALVDPSTNIGYPEVRRGLVPALVMALLIRRVSQKDLRELVLLGQMVDSRRALEMGLVNEIIPKGSQLNEALLKAAIILKNGPNAIKETKHLIDVYYPVPFEDDLFQGLTVHKTMRETEEAREGMKAFFEKREPKWN